MNDKNLDIAGALRDIAHSITPLDASPVSVGNNKQVGSLTEAVMYLANGMYAIAEAIGERPFEGDEKANAIFSVTEAIRDHTEFLKEG
jgi:hypothetical protein